MVAQLVAVLCILDFVAVDVGGLYPGEVFSLHAVVLTGSEAVPAHTLGLTVDGGQRFKVFAVLGRCRHFKGILGLREEVVAIVSTGTCERTVRFLREFLQPLVEHHGDDFLGVRVDVIVHITFLIIRESIVLHAEAYLAVRHLLVLSEDVDGFLGVRHLLVYDLCRVGRNGRLRPELLDFAFDMVYIHIADDDDALIVGTVPLLIVVAEVLIREIVDNAHQADRHTVSVLGVGIELRQYVVINPHDRAAAQLPFLVDDPAFLVDFLVGKRQAVRPVLEDQQAGVECALAGRRHVADTVDGLVDAGIGIQVAAELNAERTGEFQQCGVGEVLRPIEGHVLQEVGQPSLLVVLLDRADPLCNVEVGYMLRPLVVQDVVSQAVAELALPHVLVHGNRPHLLRRHHSRHKEQDNQE